MSTMTEREHKKKHQTVTVEAASNGWIVRVPGKSPEIFSLWHQVEARLRTELTTREGAHAQSID